jgi:hypothetical protein
MEYEAKTYFTENEYDTVSGFTIIDASDGRYHIAEKWEKDDGEDSWLSYGVPESDFTERVERGACEKKARLSDEQYAAVCEKVGWDYHKGETPAQQEA